MEFEILTDLLLNAFQGCDRELAEHAADYLLSKGVTIESEKEMLYKNQIRALELRNEYLTGMREGFKLAVGKGETYGKEKHTAGR